MDEFTQILEAIEAGDLSGFTDEQLTEARDQIMAYGRELKNTDASGDELTELVSDAKTLAAAVGTIDVELGERATQRTADEKAKDEAFATFDQAPDDDDETDGDDSEDDSEDEEVSAEKEKEPVLAASVIRRRGEIVKPPDAEPRDDRPKALVAAAVGSDRMGETFGDPEQAASYLFDARRRFTAMGDHPVLRIPIDTGTELGADSMENFAKLRDLRKGVVAARAKGEGLVAAGFCAPLQVVYDYFSAASATAGTIDLPEVTATRGRISYPVPITPASLANTPGIGSSFTGADDSAGTVKDCFTVVCGDDDPYELTATYSCLRLSNFDQVFYPERVEAVEETALVVAAHATNARLIDDIVTSSRTTFVNDLEDQGGSWVTFVRSVARESKRLRQAHKLGTEAPLEVVVPYWFSGSLAADTTARDSSTLGSLVASQMAIEAELAKLSVNVQWVYDWQESGVAGGFDGFVSYLMFAPGAVVHLRGATIDLGVVRDHTLNLANDFSIFVETFDGIAIPGDEVLYVSGVPACPTGATGNRVTITCAGS